MQLGLFENPTVTSPKQSKAVSRETKRAAYLAVDGHGQRQVVLDAVAQSGASGLTRNEIAERLGIALSSVCGRVTELLESGDVFQQPGVKRNKRAVVFAKGSC